MARGLKRPIARFLIGCWLATVGLVHHDVLAQSSDEPREVQELTGTEVPEFQKKVLILEPPPIEKGQKGYVEGEAQSLETLRADLLAKIDHTKLDPKILQEHLGSDPLILLSFVRDQIAFEPYVGALRGSRGTLQARSGNATDRALLLAKLLRHAGYRIRFAEADLTESQAEVLIHQALSPTQEVLTNLPNFLDAMLANAAEHFLLLADALNNAGFVPNSGSAGSELRRALVNSQRHIWVQFTDRNGQWHDLDPSPGLESGEIFAPAESGA